MEEHEVKTVRFNEQATFKNVQVEYEAICYLCENADELYMDEQQLQENDIRLKDAYRKKKGLLTSYEISAIRKKYGISQSDLCILLGWGQKTITRYESHQVQDKAHDTILKKINHDPEWFITLLHEAKDNLSTASYDKYLATATKQYEDQQDVYLRKSITASYVKYQDNTMANGNAKLSLNKVVDIIRYFAASPRITSLYKVKLMKLMWYADALSYKQRGQAMTGLVYQALPMGAVPIAYQSIIALKNIPCEEIEIGEICACHFSLKKLVTYPSLSQDDIKILDEVIEKLGGMSKNDIVQFMHSEQAYIETTPWDIIQFKYAKNLQI